MLYNFEHVPLPEKLMSMDVGVGGPGDTPPSTRGRSLVGADVLSVYQRFHVWDYSRCVPRPRVGHSCHMDGRELRVDLV